MSVLARIKNRLASKLIALSPTLSRRAMASVHTLDMTEKKIPWSAPDKPIEACTVALVTTAGLHHTDQHPFYMHNQEGDSSFREIEPGREIITITHDYYDHSAADRDINVVFPIDRLRELAKEGTIGGVAKWHYSFMGHLLGNQLRYLMGNTAPEVASTLKSQCVDIVVLTPG